MKQPDMKRTDSKEPLFSRNPRISLADVRGWIERQKEGDETVKVQLIDFVDHRLRGRYITPLQNVKPRKYRSGFLMMAASCLLIEALQSFYEGLIDTKSASAKSFKDFFKRNTVTFPKFAECFPGVAADRKEDSFYYNIRCGILHQAETTGGYSIVRDKSDLFDPKKQTVNADRFLDSVEACLNSYLDELRSSHVTSGLWAKAAKKLTSVCDNFGKAGT